ncbi:MULTISPECIES: CvpA family protein [Hahella]|uniref:Uncharacterized membrane protein, required for colicin V production n=1 Tax=Hahella chejuensis (strain KCTC 2396) TaxID=349521 RepID=Q2SJC6_HAHCH|nr:uncharacterized membrane protein, required for colicin V production [Hahella chejuensis KCTC 2396]
MMIWADWVIIGIIGLSTVVSLVRGFVKEALSLVTWVLAFIVARMFYVHLATLLEGLISVPSVRLIAAFVILFIVTLIIGALLNHLISALVKSTGLSGTDRTLGMAFGMIRGVVLVVVVVALLRLTPVVQDPWWSESTLIPHFEKLEAWSRSVFGDPIASMLT